MGGSIQPILDEPVGAPVSEAGLSPSSLKMRWASIGILRRVIVARRACDAAMYEFPNGILCYGTTTDRGHRPCLIVRSYNCHINVEVCMSVKSCKYIYKYIHKGGDRAMFDLTTEEGRRLRDVDRAARRDEIHYYQDNRSVGACEAAWRIFSFGLADISPSVVRLPAHLENGQRVYFDNGNDTEAVAARAHAGPPETHLTAWFRWNETCAENEKYPYYKMPHYCTWNKTSKVWSRRERGCGAVGRLHTISPTSGEVYYLRVLLHHPSSNGAKGFSDLKTVDGEVHETFRAACAALGIIDDDREWDAALADAVTFAMPSQLRDLYVSLLTCCEVGSPVALFDKYKAEMADDFRLKLTEVSTLRMIVFDSAARLVCRPPNRTVHCRSLVWQRNRGMGC